MKYPGSFDESQNTEPHLSERKQKETTHERESRTLSVGGESITGDETSHAGVGGGVAGSRFLHFQETNVSQIQLTMSFNSNCNLPAFSYSFGSNVWESVDLMS